MISKKLQIQPQIIQILGQSRSGKDWVASNLKSYYESIGKSVEIYSYASPLKQITCTLFGLTFEQLDDFKNRSDNVSIEVYDQLHCNGSTFQFELNFRILLQRMGNEAIKPIFGNDVWAKLAQQHIANSSVDIIIIPDCRFLVELTAIGGTTIRVINESLPPPMQHASELELLNFTTDIILNNTNYCLTPQVIADIAHTILKDS